MKSGFLAWLALALWATWAIALQGAWSHSGFGGAWSPEVGVVLVIGLASRMTPERARGGALILGLVRGALSAEPLVATVAAYLVLAELVAALRRSVDTEEVFLRTTLAALGGGGLGLWFALVHGLRSPAPAAWTVGVADRVGPVAITTALFAFVLGGWLRRLPGIGPLWKKELPWGVAAHAR